MITPRCFKIMPVTISARSRGILAKLQRTTSLPRQSTGRVPPGAGLGLGRSIAEWRDDPKIMATVSALEDYFRYQYPSSQFTRGANTTAPPIGCCSLRRLAGIEAATQSPTSAAQARVRQASVLSASGGAATAMMRARHGSNAQALHSRHDR